MNFYKLNQLLNEELQPDSSDSSGVSEPANDKTVSNMLDMMKGLIDKVSNEALKAKIKKFMDEMTGTEKKSNTQEKTKPEPATSPDAGAAPPAPPEAAAPPTPPAGMSPSPPSPQAPQASLPVPPAGQ